MTMKLIQRGLFRLCFSTIVLIKIKTRYIFKKAVLNPPPLDSIVPSSVNIDKMQDDEDEVKKEEFPQTQSLLALEQEGLAEYEGEVGGR